MVHLAGEVLDQEMINKELFSGAMIRVIARSTTAPLSEKDLPSCGQFPVDSNLTGTSEVVS